MHGPIDRLGFFGLDLGSLSIGSRLVQFPGGPLPTHNFVKFQEGEHYQDGYSDDAPDDQQDGAKQIRDYAPSSAVEKRSLALLMAAGPLIP